MTLDEFGEGLQQALYEKLVENPHMSVEDIHGTTMDFYKCHTDVPIELEELSCGCTAVARISPELEVSFSAEYKA